MIAVWTNTGMGMQIGDALLDPNVPTLFEELPPEVDFQRVNLRIEEVDGPGSASLVAGSYRDASGQTFGAPAVSSSIDAEREGQPGSGVVYSEAHIALSEERNAYKARAEEAEGKVALLEVFLPSDAAIKNLGLDGLKALAQYRGKTVEGDDKAAYVAALTASA